MTQVGLKYLIRSGAVSAEAARANKIPAHQTQAQMTSVRDGGVGSAGSLGPGMYDSGRYHEYIRRHVASPYLKPPKADKARSSAGDSLGPGADDGGCDDDQLESGV